MDATESGVGEGIEKREAGIWTRRDVVKAMGAGALSAAVPLRPSLAPATLKVRIYGAVIVNKYKSDNYTDILMPHANYAAGFKHRDCRTLKCETARPHLPRLAFYHDYTDGQFVDDVSIAGGAVTLLGAPGDDQGNLTSLIPLSELMPQGTTPVKDPNQSSRRYAARIRLIGGTIKPLTASSGSWRIAKWKNAEGDPTAYLDNKNVYGLEWDSGLVSVLVSSARTRGSLPSVLSVFAHQAVVLGHLPHHPRHWFKKATAEDIRLSTNDFKWLYTSFIPLTRTGQPQTSNDPWPERLEWRKFSVPEQTRLAADGANPAEVQMITSPTCFGGCWTCE